jgi:hypothetical protein
MAVSLLMAVNVRALSHIWRRLNPPLPESDPLS